MMYGVHIQLCSHFRYFVTFVDDYSRTTWLYLMKNHSELFSHFRALCTEIHTRFHVSVQNLRSDNAKEYMSEQFQSFMLQNDILHQTSCVDTPSQNGVAERKNRHLLETAQALLFQMHVPKHFWANAISTTCFLINWIPSFVFNWVTSFQTLFPHKSLFPNEPWVFGCTCFVQDVRPHVSKLDHKGYRYYCPSLRKYLVSANVTFLENTYFSQDPIHTSHGECDDLLVHTLASPAPASILPLKKPPITQVYARRRHPPNLEPSSSCFDIRSNSQ